MIVERDRLLVGTTGDYKPFSYLDPKTGEYEGYDIDAARKFGESLKQ
jgi:cyclohexadienyl dehydratase